MNNSTHRESVSVRKYEFLKRYLRSTKVKFKYITDIKTIIRDGMIFLPAIVVNDKKFDFDSAIEYIKTKGIKPNDRVILYGIPSRRKEKHK